MYYKNEVILELAYNGWGSFYVRTENEEDWVEYQDSPNNWARYVNDPNIARDVIVDSKIVATDDKFFGIPELK